MSLCNAIYSTSAPKTGPSVRVLVAEHHRLMRRLLVLHLTREPGVAVVGEASNGSEAVSLARLLQPNVAVVQFLLPTLNGPQVTERLQREAPQVRVILLTEVEGLESIGEQAGAARCLYTRACTPEELATAVRQAHFSQPSTQAQVVVNRQAAVERVTRRISLSERGHHVLQQVICTELTAHQIASAMTRGSQARVTESSVRHTLDRVMTKLQLEPRTRAALVKFVLEDGAQAGLPVRS